MKLRLNLISVTGIAAAAILVAIGGWLAFENIAQAQTDLPAPSNTRAINGDDSGDVVVSWDSVSGASGYSVR